MIHDGNYCINFAWTKYKLFKNIYISQVMESEKVRNSVREMCEGFMLFLCLSESAENGIVLFIYDHIYL